MSQRPAYDRERCPTGSAASRFPGVLSRKILTLSFEASLYYFKGERLIEIVSKTLLGGGGKRPILDHMESVQLKAEVLMLLLLHHSESTDSSYYRLFPTIAFANTWKTRKRELSANLYNPKKKTGNNSDTLFRSAL